MVEWETPCARCEGTADRRGRGPARAVPASKLLSLLTIVIPLGGCSADLQGRQAARIVELERYSQELEAKVTALKEASLKGAARSACAPSSPTQGGDPTTSGAQPTVAAPGKGASEHPRAGSTTAAPSNLPVVRLSPAHPFATAEEDAHPQDADSAEDAAELLSDAEVASSDQTRPVLKLHGGQEGKVIMRTVTAAEKDTTL